MQDNLSGLRKGLSIEVAMRHAYTVLTVLDRANGSAKPDEIRVEADMSENQLRVGAMLLRVMGLVAYERRRGEWRYYRLPSVAGES